VPYDTLIVCGGASHSYFDHADWEECAPGLKTLEDALDLRRRILLAFEAAEIDPAGEHEREWLTFVVVGAGPTGVEMAGQIAEIARDIHRDFRRANSRAARVLLLEAADRILLGFDPRLSTRAEAALERVGVSVRTRSRVVGPDQRSVTIERDGDLRERVPAHTVVWAAGVAASPLAAALAEASGEAVDRNGRVRVTADLSLATRPEVLALGDVAALPTPLPGIASVASQQGAYAARLVHARLAAGPLPAPFRYRDKGSLAVIGRANAIAQVRNLRLSGLAAWLVWFLRAPVLPHGLPESCSPLDPLELKLLHRRSRRPTDHRRRKRAVRQAPPR
jgi:NADH dehydrogenase